MQILNLPLVFGWGNYSCVSKTGHDTHGQPGQEENQRDSLD